VGAWGAWVRTGLRRDTGSNSSATHELLARLAMYERTGLKDSATSTFCAAIFSERSCSRALGMMLVATALRLDMMKSAVARVLM
jgi:hypothetical protein